MAVSGVLAATLRVVEDLEVEILQRIDTVETAFEQKNWGLRWPIKTLQM